MNYSFKYNNKKICRKEAKNIRNNIDMNNVSMKIAEILEQQDFFVKAKNVLSFYPFSSEVDLRKLFELKNKKWYLPVCDDENKALYIYEYLTDRDLVKNKWGIFEPSCKHEPIPPSLIDLVLIPALAVDSFGYRLGYGGGFYDRFLGHLREDCVKIVPIPDELFVEKLPFDKWDVPVDVVITQSKIIEIQ